MRADGFTLLELLLAATLTTTVMASAFAAADLFARTDRIVIENDERGIDCVRALRFLREDVQHAASLTITVDQVQIVRCDGKHVTWVAVATSAELHRVDGASALAVATKVAAIVAAGPRKFARDGRGHLPDTAWSDTAVLQGSFTFAATPFRSVYNGAVVGVHFAISWTEGGVLQQRTTTSCSFSLAEANAKPPM